mgnify:CR=1 FL=1
MEYPTYDLSLLIKKALSLQLSSPSLVQARHPTLVLRDSGTRVQDARDRDLRPLPGLEMCPWVVCRWKTTFMNLFTSRLRYLKTTFEVLLLLRRKLTCVRHLPLCLWSIVLTGNKHDSRTIGPEVEGHVLRKYPLLLTPRCKVGYSANFRHRDL